MKLFKKVIIVLFLMRAPLIVASAGSPLLVAVIMVKNEESVIAKTLKPLVEGGIDAFYVFDTGSTDATMDNARSYLTEQGIKNFCISQEPFIDFAMSRNRAIDLTEEYFPQATFMLMLDAEWYLQGTAQLLQYCARIKNETFPSYSLRLAYNNLDEFYVERLIRCGSGIRFKGLVHETLEYTMNQHVPESIFFMCNPARQGIEKSQKRWLRDKDLLFKEYEQNQDDPRTVFYLAQTYDCLGDLEHAYKFYSLRVKMRGWDEENFMAQYRLAQVAERMYQQNPEKKEFWAVALDHYLTAYAMRPCRAEPLIRIAQHYRAQQEFQLSYFFIKNACEIPCPRGERLFVEKSLYDFDRHDLLSQVSWYIGHYEEGERALRALIADHADVPHLYRNLAFYMERKKKAMAELELLA